MGTALPAVSVIICHHAGRALLQRCLDSVAQSRGVTWETIVVTSDATYTNPAVILYFLNDGPAAKRNLGAYYASGNVLAFLDDDVEVSPYTLYELWRWLEDTPQCGMAFAKIYKMEEGRRDEFDDCGSWLTWTGFLYSRSRNAVRDTGQFSRATRCLAGKSATCVVRRAAFTQVGGFDGNYYILGEETDLAWRLWLQGWEVWYNPRAVSWHAFGCESLKPKKAHYSLWRTHGLGCRNYLTCLTTNLGLSRLWTILPLHLAIWLAAALGFALQGEGARGRMVLCGLWAYLRSLPQTLHKRRRVQSTRIASDHTLWPIITAHPPVSYYVGRLWRYWTTQLHG